MAIFKCNLNDCDFESSDVNAFLFHHGNHPYTDRNRFVCSQRRCLKDLGNKKSFQDHMRKHARTNIGMVT